MNRGRTPVISFLLSVVSALTAALALMSWRGLSETDEHMPGALLVCGAIGLLAGLARCLGARDTRAWLAGAVAGGATALWWCTGSPLPTATGLESLAQILRTDLDAVRSYSVPIPADATSLAVPLVLGAAVLALVLDLLVVCRNWVLGGILLVLVVNVAPSGLHGQVRWMDFVPVAVGLVLILLLTQLREVAGWRVRGALGTSGTPGRRTLPAWGLAGSAAAISICVAIGISTLPLTPQPLWDRGDKSGRTGSEVTIANPLVDMRRDLTRGADTDVLLVTSEGAAPEYLRTAVLTEYDGVQWTTGDRNASASQVADGPLPPLPGLSSDVPTSARTYDLDALSGLRSRWLPLPENVVDVQAAGDWRYDDETRDFVAWEDDLDTSNLSWSTTALRARLDPTALDAAPLPRPPGGDRWTEVPSDLPPLVAQLAEQVTRDEETAFRRARALQSWFRSEFTYSLDRVASVGDDDLTAFLRPDGRVGYCEQFAASMALMARTLDIPARVAVGFLEPERMGERSWVFSAHDMHAWPELYFEGAGWVRFEPTPGARAEGVPAYTNTPLEGEEAQEPSASASPSVSPQPSPSAQPSAGAQPRTTPTTVAQDEGPPWGKVIGAVGALALLVLLVLSPGLWRARQRRNRLASHDPDQWWTELRCTVKDLGHHWPVRLSPRAQTRVISDLLGDDASKRDLDRLLLHVEEHRFAPAGHSSPAAASATGRADAAPDDGAHSARRVVDALGQAAGRRRRMVARLAPRSLAEPRPHSPAR